MPEDFRTYDLRHTCASLMIAAGAHPRALMERLGHKDIKTTLNVYGHLLPELQEELSDRLDTIYRKRSRPPAGRLSSRAQSLITRSPPRISWPTR